MTESLNQLGSIALLWGAQALLFGTILAILTALACSLVFRKTRPALHGFLWTIVLIRFLLPPVLPSLPYLSDVANRLSSGAVAILPLGTEATSDAGGMASPSTAVAPLEHSPRAESLSWVWIVLTLYLAGLTPLTIRFLRRDRRQRRWISRQRLADSDLSGTVRSLAHQIGLKTIPEVRVTDELMSPLVLGVHHPQLVLSLPLWGSLSAEAARALVAHELAHIVRRDHVVRYLQTVAGLLFYFWWPVHWVCRRLDRAAELACDQWALSATSVAPRDYARSLLTVVRSLNREVGCASPVCFANKRSSMEERFEMILNNRSAFPAKLSWTVVPVLGLWCVFALAGSSPVVSQDDSTDQPEKLVVHIRGDVSHLSLKSHILPEADTDGDGHLSLQELQDFQALYPDRVDLTVEPAESGQQEVNVRVARHVSENGPLWISAGDEQLPHSVVLEEVTEVDRDQILVQNPQADADGDGRLSDDEFRAFLGDNPRKIEIHVEAEGPGGPVARQVTVKGGDAIFYSADGKNLSEGLDSTQLLREHPELDENGDGAIDPSELARHTDHTGGLQVEKGSNQRLEVEKIVIHRTKAPELDSAERRAKFLEEHPEADLDGDGVISKSEAEALAAKAQKP